MNLTGQKPYRKGQKLRKSRGVSCPPTQLERRYWNVLRDLGCIVAAISCRGPITIHHCGTGAGGRKDHKKVIPLCWEHHIGAEGIDGRRMSKRAWQEKYGTETVLLKRLERLLKSGGDNA